jgi:hypothetical protein
MLVYVLAALATVVVILSVFHFVPPRFIRWVLCGLLLSLLPLFLVALSTWKQGSEEFSQAFLTEELLAVGLTLAGAAGVEAFAAPPPFQPIRRGIGLTTILVAMTCVGLYVLFKIGGQNLSREFVKQIELIAFCSAAILSLFSVLVAGP